jgi:hypothetical protein
VTDHVTHTCKKKNYSGSLYFMISNNLNKFANSHTAVTRSTEKMHLSYCLYRVGIKLRLDCMGMKVISLKRPLTCCNLANKITGQQNRDRISITSKKSTSTFAHCFNSNCYHLYWQEYRLNSIVSFIAGLLIRLVLMQIQLFNGKKLMN